MEQRRQQDEPAHEKAPTSARRRRPKLSVVRKTSYTLDELPALLEKLRHQEPSPEEIARRTRVVERAARLRAELADVDIPVDELLLQAREELAGGRVWATMDLPDAGTASADPVPPRRPAAAQRQRQAVSPALWIEDYQPAR